MRKGVKKYKTKILIYLLEKYTFSKKYSKRFGSTFSKGG